MKTKEEVQAQIDDLLQEAEDYRLEGQRDLALSVLGITKYLRWVLN